MFRRRNVLAVLCALSIPLSPAAVADSSWDCFDSSCSYEPEYYTADSYESDYRYSEYSSETEEYAAEYSAYEASDELAEPFVASEAESSSAYGSSEAATYAEESAEVYGAEYTEAPDAYIPVIESLEDLELYTTCMNIETDALVLHQQCVDVQMQCDELMWDAAVDESNSEFGEVLNNATEEAFRQCQSERTNLMLEMREVWDRYFQAGCAYDNQGDILGVNLYDPCTINTPDFELGSD